jgi:hypothetical protein
VVDATHHLRCSHATYKSTMIDIDDYPTHVSSGLNVKHSNSIVGHTQANQAREYACHADAWRAQDERGDLRDPLTC